MLWGQNQVSEFSATINKTITDRHVSVVLGMNESVLFHPVLSCGFLTVLQAAGIRAIEFDSGTGCSDVDNIPRATASTRGTVGQPCPKQCTIRTHLVAKFSHLVRRRMYS
jgi:hypothetical protein